MDCRVTCTLVKCTILQRPENCQSNGCRRKPFMIKCSRQRVTCKLQDIMCVKSARFLVSGFKPLFEESPNLGPVHTTPKKFANEGFTLKTHQTLSIQQTSAREFKDVRAHCYCASLVRTLFIGHARATSFSSARKTQQNIELMTFALTWCANIFVGRSVTPTFFSADRFLF